jgi:oligoendopeptidase F
MEKEKLNELVTKYNEGVADPSEIQQIEKLIEKGELLLTQLTSLEKLNDQIEMMREENTSLNQDNRFYQMLMEEKRKAQPSFSISWPELFEWMPRLGFAAAVLVVGFAAGYYFQKPSGGDEVKQLTQQVQGLKEMMMISMLEKESATDRLKAVSLTEDIDGPSKKVTEALLKTLNEDPSVNVRLAALDALEKFIKLPQVREGLVRSIATQDSPLVQVTLAELMVAMQEKSSVKELKKVLDQKGTPKEVKEKIRESIKVLI